jgi:hypothetical protein
MRLYLPILLAATTLLSCTPVVYTPGAHTLPTIDGPGQVYTGLSAGPGGFDAQAAWSPLERLYVHGGASWGSDAQDSTEHYRFFEGGVGAYVNVGKRGGAVGSIAASFGAGYASDGAIEVDVMSPYNIERQAYGDYTRASLQLAMQSIAFEKGEDLDDLRFGWAVATRVSRIGFAELATRERTRMPGSDGGDSVGEWFMTLTGRATGYFLESALIARVGSPLIMFDYRFGWTLTLDSPAIGADPLTMSVGAHLRLDRLF